MGSFRYGLTFHFIGPSVKDQQRNRLTVQYVPQTRKSLVKGERFIRCVWKTWLVVNITWIAIQTVFTGIWNWPWGLTGEEKHCLYLLACAMHAQSHHEHTSSICWLDVHCTSLSWSGWRILWPDAHICMIWSKWCLLWHLHKAILDSRGSWLIHTS